MAFSVIVKDKPEELVFDVPSKWCRITINDFTEDFAVPLDTWDIGEYQSQWAASLKAIVEGADKACLVTAMRNPKDADFIAMFVLYRVGQAVFVQNQIVLCGGNESKISNEQFDSLIEGRETQTEDGAKISEWRTSIQEIANA